jgi:hypothetical protein
MSTLAVLTDVRKHPVLNSSRKKGGSRGKGNKRVVV